VTRLAAALAATLGRRLLVRIWLHGVLLFAGVLATFIIARFVLPGHDAALTAHTHPRFVLGLAERALAIRGDRALLVRELRIIRDQTGVALAVYGADGALLGASREHAPPPATPDELRALAPSPGHLPLTRSRIIVGAFAGGALVAHAIAFPPPIQLMSRHGFVLLLAALALALVFVALPLSRSIARPLEQLGAAARALGAGRLSVRAPTDRRDEIGDLARSFNRMAEQIQQLRLAERELLGDVSHELRTPLARMRVVLELASDADPDRTRRYVREIATDLAELEQLVDDIIASARLDADAPPGDAAPAADSRPALRDRQVSTRELVDAAARRFADRYPHRALTCTGASDDLLVHGDPIWLRRALDNLIDNARKYSPDTAAIAVRVTPDDLRGAPAIRIEVADRGIGIAPEDRPRVFTPLFRADRSRTRATGGVGLGLALTRRIVEAHGGAIDFASEPDIGSRFWFILPGRASAAG
jgi:signal transduction histidine kinase